MKRQTFVTSALSVAFLGGNASGVLAQVAGSSPLLPSFANGVDPDNVLVVIQMGGGNDGLNTVVPWSDDAYHRVRPAIRVTETQVLKLNDRIGFNPALKGLNELYKQGRVALLQGVGYPNPNRSHFEATQIWETASPIARSSTAGSGGISTGVSPALRNPRRCSKPCRSATRCPRRWWRRTSRCPRSARSTRSRTTPVATSRRSRAPACCTTARRPVSRRTCR